MIASGWTLPFWLVALACLGGGLWRLGGALWALQCWRKCQGWAQAPGTITTSGVRRVWEQRSVNALDWRSSWAQLAYTYTVGGRAYQGRRIAFGYRGLSRGGAEDLAARYPVGASVTVTYDPVRPEQAVLEPDPAWTGLIYQLAAGAGLLLVGIVLVLAVAGR